MLIKVDKVVDDFWMREACAFTSGKESNMTLNKIYSCEHSPVRTQRFMVRMYDIPTFVSVHFVRHDVGLDHFSKTDPKDDTVHFVKSNREDRNGGNKEVGRWEPVNHMIDCNAQALINMARKRLCSKAHNETIKVMRMIREEVRKVDPDLAKYMVRECEYRNGCHELKSCGWFNFNSQA